jgi:hypothetical protein
MEISLTTVLGDGAGLWCVAPVDFSSPVRLGKHFAAFTQRLTAEAHLAH